MKYCILGMVIIVLTSCSGVLWEGLDRGASNTQTITITINDPLLEIIKLQNIYKLSEYYGVISFGEWYTLMYLQEQ